MISFFVDETISGNFSNATIFMYGDITCEPGTRFTEDDIFLATDAQILLQSGTNLSFTECSLTKLCDDSWDRIYVNGSDDQSLLMDGCTFERSLRGVFAVNDAPIALTGNLHQANRIGLFVENYTSAGVYNSSHIKVDGCTFTETVSLSQITQHPQSTIVLSNFFPTFCNGTPATYPIVVRNSVEINLGHSSYLQNTFDNPNNYVTEKNICERQQLASAIGKKPF